MSITKTCKTCSENFQGSNKSLYCSNKCRPRNAKRQEVKELPPTFVAIDGEGITRPIVDGFAEHIYDMLSCGDRTIVSEDGTDLKWYECFEFLWKCFQEDKITVPKPYYVGFFLSYDFTQWTKTLPEREGISLWAGKGRRTKLGRVMPADCEAPDGTVWQFDVLGKKRFQLSRSDSSDTMFINDTGPYFQTSFINVIKPKGKLDLEIISIEEYAIIEEGKSVRGAHQTLAQQMETREATKTYNLLENKILSRIITRLDKGMRDAGIFLDSKSWYGPGQASQQWMKNIGIPQTKELDELLEEDIYEAAQASYYGGWFEILNHGHVPGTTYEYDINSAYPAIIAELPCLLCGFWERLSGDDKPHDDSYTLCNVEVVGANDELGPLPFRSSKGRILRPLHVNGWYWQHELDAANRAGLIADIRVLERISYAPSDKCRHENGKPFKEIANLYQRRLAVGKGSPAGTAYKLIYNSAYGKTAQSIGVPQFASPVYASLITAGCRTMILDAITTHPVGVADVVMVATDGIYFRSQHDSLPLNGETLGLWEEQTKQNLTLFMPGVYWDDKSRKAVAQGAAISVKSRGISAKTLSKEMGRIDSAFSQMLTEEIAEDILDCPFDIYSEFDMISPVSAVARGNWDLAGELSTYEKDGEWHVGSLRTINTDPRLKRNTEYLWNDRGSFRSQAYTEFLDQNGIPVHDTTPYDKEFGHEIRDSYELDFLSPEFINNPFGE